MNTIIILTVLVVIFALTFDFINGFHDTANAIATSVSTRALPPRVAIIMAATMNFIGAITFVGVAKALTKDIVDPFSLNAFEGDTTGSVVILAALISAIIWNLLTWYFGIPSSSSHTLIGSIAGAAVASAGFNVLNYGGFTKIIMALVFSPILAICAGFIMMTLFKLWFKNLNLYRTNKGFRTMQIFTAAIQSFTHGTNDAQKAMGIMTMALIAGGLHSGDDIPFWVRAAAAAAMGLGTSIGGVGSAQRVRGVNWGMARKIVTTWVITMPISAVMASVTYFVLSLFF